MTTQKLRIWGWYAFDWASQPYHTLILTFIFAPYFVTVVGDAVAAQVMWGRALFWTGIVSALLAPIVGALADQSGHLVRWVAWLALLYVGACLALWFALPGMENGVWLILVAFAIGLVAAEMAIIVTNAFLPTLAREGEIGELSGTGFAIGYAGGLLALLMMLLFFAQGDGGRTILGLPPAFGLDPETYQGTRFVGPFCAAWFLLFMVPFFRWVRDPVRDGPNMSIAEAVRGGMVNLRAMLRRAAGRRSLIMFLTSSMFYRDALNGLYFFGGIYATGVLGWSPIKVGIFGILGVATAVVASWLGGLCDKRFGPKPVIAVCIPVLIAVSALVVGLTRESLFGIPLPPGSQLPDLIMYGCGATIGGMGGALQAASRTMMVRHAEPEHPTEAFGLFAMTGKATAFLAPLLVTWATEATGDQRLGVSPLIALFLIGLILLPFVEKNGDR